MAITGILNVYYPFELEDEGLSKQINHLYDKTRNRQLRTIHHTQQPRTNLMDLLILRKEVEDVLLLGQRMMQKTLKNECELYATSNIAKAYRKNREDNLFVREPSVIISEFSLVCHGVNFPYNPIEGRLYYFNNLSNHVGAYMVALSFQNLTIDGIMRMKHVFYKRALVQVDEHQSEKSTVNEIHGCMTFPEYVDLKSHEQAYRRKSDIDYRARYMFLEIDDSGLNQEEVYGLLTANEKYMYVPKGKTSLKNYSNSDTYSLFYHLRDALIVNYSNYKAVLQRQKVFFEELLFDSNKIPVEVMGHDKWIAGLEKGRFPEYLKTVEIHLLTNNALRHETVRHEISYYNPHVMFKRCHRLWKLFYEMDMNHCYINSTMFKNFGVYDNLRELKEEYTYLTTHCLNYSILAFTIIMAIFSLITVLK